MLSPCRRSRGGEACVVISHSGGGVEELNVGEGEPHFFERPVKRGRPKESTDAA
jgi:hypothetical protein